jgi:Domain of unknown function (DUF5668)
MADDTRLRCPCARCRMHGLLGPVMIITVGVIFLLSEYTPYGIGHLWPLFLIIVGVFRLAETMVSDEGHIRS